MWVVYLFIFALLGQGLCAPTRQKRQIFGITPDFGRAIPNSVYHGEIGGLFGSPVFGPGLTGPFNDPILRQMRIEELYDEVRRINGVPQMREQFRLTGPGDRLVDIDSIPFMALGGPMGPMGMGLMGGMGMMGGLGMGMPFMG